MMCNNSSKVLALLFIWASGLYDIEMMKIELERIDDAGLTDKLLYLEAEAVLRQEYRLELEFLEKSKEK